MDINAIEFGKYLKKMRNNLGITLQELGNKTGLSKSYLSHIENGRRGIPGPELLRKIGKVFDEICDDPLTDNYSNLMILAGYWDHHEVIPESVIKLIEEEIKSERDLHLFLQQKEINYKSILLTEQDKKLITHYLNTLFEIRIKED